MRDANIRRAHDKRTVAMAGLVVCGRDALRKNLLLWKHDICVRSITIMLWLRVTTLRVRSVFSSSSISQSSLPISLSQASFLHSLHHALFLLRPPFQALFQLPPCLLRHYIFRCFWIPHNEWRHWDWIARQVEIVKMQAKKLTQCEM